jgi:hypothetical protein
MLPEMDPTRVLVSAKVASFESARSMFNASLKIIDFCIRQRLASKPADGNVSGEKSREVLRWS